MLQKRVAVCSLSREQVSVSAGKKVELAGESLEKLDLP